MSLNFFFFILLTLFIFSCSLAPEYSRPKAPIPKSFPQTKESGPPESLKNISKLKWTDFYQLPELRELIKLAHLNNRDYLIALSNVKAVQAQYNITKSELIPTINGTASMSRRKVPSNSIPSSRFGGLVVPGYIDEQYSLEVGITAYELDFFGRINNLKQAALQEYMASKEASRMIKILLISEIAHTYMRYLANLELEKLALQTAASQEQTVAIVRDRFKTGLSSELDFQQANTLLAQAKADSFSYSRQVAMAKNALVLLIGTPKASKYLEQTSFQDALSSIKEVPLKLDSSVLLARPDIQEAEHLLIAANANIGAARAAFFPRVSLTTSIGKLSSETSNLFESNSTTWAFVPEIALPIFTGGRNKAQLNLAHVRKDIRILRYERVIQTAFKEVSDALLSNEKLKQQIQAQREVVMASKKSHQISRERYRSGIENFLSELDARRSLYSAQRRLINQQYEYFSNLSELYQVLGGGVHD